MASRAALAFLLPLISLQCILPTVFDCSNIQTKCDGADKIESLPITIYNCSTPLELTANQLLIQGFFTALTLNGANISIANLTILENLNINVSQALNISGEIGAGGMVLIGSNSSAMMNVSGASVDAEKIVMVGSSVISIVESEMVTSWNLCLYESLNIISISNEMQSMITNADAAALATLSFSLFLIANSSISFQQSNVTTVSLAAVANSNISVFNSNINASAQSCKTNSGLGRGAIIQYNNAYCTSGSSSCGFGEISNATLCADIIQYFLFLSHAFPYISKGPYLSTGSGGYGYNTELDGRGAGGGIIFIFSRDQFLIVSSLIQANGGNVNQNDSLSAGSGGTVFITAKHVEGLGANNITASGGDCYNNKGGGGGGLVKISYSTVYQNPSYSLWVNINQGYQQNSPTIQISSNGIFYGPQCQGGNQAYYLGCMSCNATSYSTLGDPVCRSCPSSSEFDIDGSIQNKSLISDCYSIKKESDVLRLFSPGEIDVLNIGIYLIALVVFTIIGVVLKKRIKKEKLLSGEQFRLEDVQKDIDKAKILALELRKSRDIKPYELMYHTHRISCFGSNSHSSPWVLPSHAPPEVRQYVLPQVYANFAENFNRKARWSRGQYWLAMATLAVYPLYWYYLDRIKKKKYKKLQGVLEDAIDFNLINNYDYEDRSIVTIKFSKNKDYTNCYLDFFLYERADLQYFSLASPYILYLSGEGNFLRPFYLEEGDVFFRLMFFVVNRQFMRSQESLDEKKQLFTNMVSQKKKQKNNFQLNRFLRKLNTLACTLDLSSPHKDILQVLWSLVEFIEKWNQDFFNRVAVQLDLVIFMSRLMNKALIDNQIHILTKKDKTQFDAFILSKIQEISSWEESSIKIGLFVYNPEQELPKEEEVRRSLLQENELLLSNDDHQEGFRKSLLISQGKKDKKMMKRVLAWIGKGLGMMRYFMMSHKNSKYDEYTIKFLQSFFILMQTMLVFIWSIRIEIPYVFVNLVMPFIGIIWFVSDSYGFGKLYLIFNAMTFINEIVTLVTYSSIETVLLDRNHNDPDILVLKNIICSLINIFIIVFMMFLGNRAITQSKKLSLKKEDDTQPLKFE